MQVLTLSSRASKLGMTHFCQRLFWLECLSISCDARYLGYIRNWNWTKQSPVSVHESWSQSSWTCYLLRAFSMCVSGVSTLSYFLRQSPLQSTQHIGTVQVDFRQTRVITWLQLQQSVQPRPSCSRSSAVDLLLMRSCLISSWTVDFDGWDAHWIWRKNSVVISSNHL